MSAGHRAAGKLLDVHYEKPMRGNGMILNNKHKRIIGVFFFLMLLSIAIVMIGNLLKRKDSYLRFSSYFIEKQKVDVLFLGNSHVRGGVFPMELWGEYGISSFNLAGIGNTIPVIYWTLVNALDYNSPRLVVMDVYDVYPYKMYSDSWGHVQDQFDSFPVSRNKILMINDLFADNTVNDPGRKKWYLLWKLPAYHTRWSDLNYKDFYNRKKIIKESRTWKGAVAENGIVNRESAEYHRYDKLDEYAYDETAREYLEKTISLCRDMNIELLLINTGFDCDDEAKLFQDSVDGLAKDNDIAYIDLTKLNVIDFSTDIRSTGHNTHFNYSGALRLTDYLGQVIERDYRLENHRGDPHYSDWEDDYKNYLKSKQFFLSKQTRLTDYLLCLRDKDYKTVMEIINPSIIEKDHIKDLLVNLGINTVSDNCLFCVDPAEDVCDVVPIESFGSTNLRTGIGDLTTECTSDGTLLLINGNRAFLIDHASADTLVKIAVYSKSSGSVVDVRFFNPDGSEG